jgi:hypothetical protein
VGRKKSAKKAAKQPADAVAPAAEPEPTPTAEPDPEPAPEKPRARKSAPRPTGNALHQAIATRLNGSVYPLLAPPWTFNRLFAARQELLPVLAFSDSVYHEIPEQWQQGLPALDDTLTAAAAFLQRVGLTGETFDVGEPRIPALLGDLFEQGLAWLKALASDSNTPPITASEQAVLDEVWSLERAAWRLVPLIVPADEQTLATMDAYRAVIQGLLAFVLAPIHDAATRAHLVAACYGLLLRVHTGVLQMPTPAQEAITT